jgi:hypothetical protein
MVILIDISDDQSVDTPCTQVCTSRPAETPDTTPESLSPGSPICVWLSFAGDEKFMYPALIDTGAGDNFLSAKTVPKSLQSVMRFEKLIESTTVTLGDHSTVECQGTCVLRTDLLNSNAVQIVSREKLTWKHLPSKSDDVELILGRAGIAALGIGTSSKNFAFQESSGKQVSIPDISRFSSVQIEELKK